MRQPKYAYKRIHTNTRTGHTDTHALTHTHANTRRLHTQAPMRTAVIVLPCRWSSCTVVEPSRDQAGFLFARDCPWYSDGNRRSLLKRCVTGCSWVHTQELVDPHLPCSVVLDCCLSCLFGQNEMHAAATHIQVPALVTRHLSACCLAPTAGTVLVVVTRVGKHPLMAFCLTGWWSPRRLTLAPAAAGVAELQQQASPDRRRRAAPAARFGGRRQAGAGGAAHPGHVARTQGKARPKEPQGTAPRLTSAFQCWVSRAHCSVRCHELIVVLGFTSSLWCWVSLAILRPRSSCWLPFVRG